MRRSGGGARGGGSGGGGVGEGGGESGAAGETPQIIEGPFGGEIDVGSPFAAPDTEQQTAKFDAV